MPSRPYLSRSTISASDLDDDGPTANDGLGDPDATDPNGVLLGPTSELSPCG